MRDDTTGDYDVGYGKPPRHTRFKKCQSGNPRGRSPEAKNLSTLLNDALNERVIVREIEGSRRVTKREAIITQLINRAAQADPRLLKIILELLQDVERRTEQVAPKTSGFGPADDKVIEQLRARFRNPGSP